MQLNYKVDGNVMTISLEGDFLGYNDDSAKALLFEEAKSDKIKKVRFESEGLKNWDSTLVVIIYELAKELRRRKIDFDKAGLPDNLQRLVNLALKVEHKPEEAQTPQQPFIIRVGAITITIYDSVKKGLAFSVEAFKSLGRYFSGTAVMRKVDLWFALEGSSYKAVAIVSLVSFMVGLILAFVGAIQLKNFGAQIYVASLVAIGMTRIMGAIMAGIIMAGRTGASYAATIGTMQVNEEIDALRTMGIPVSDFLILPRLLSLVVTMPLLTLLADMTGIIGGAAVGVIMLDIPLPEYWKYTYNALNMTNFWVGIFHGFIYGFVISLCGCYYGINSGRNADSVGIATTKAVVSAIVWMIVVTGILTWIFEALGI